MSISRLHSILPNIAVVTVVVADVVNDVVAVDDNDVVAEEDCEVVTVDVAVVAVLVGVVDAENVWLVVAVLLKDVVAVEDCDVSAELVGVVVPVVDAEVVAVVTSHAQKSVPSVWASTTPFKLVAACAQLVRNTLVTNMAPSPQPILDLTPRNCDNCVNSSTIFAIATAFDWHVSFLLLATYKR